MMIDVDDENGDTIILESANDTNSTNPYRSQRRGDIWHVPVVVHRAETGGRPGPDQGYLPDNVDSVCQIPTTILEVMFASSMGDIRAEN
jgi:hypothetical protein